MNRLCRLAGIAFLALVVLLIMGLTYGAFACDRPPPRPALYGSGWGGDISNAILGSLLPPQPGFGCDIVGAIQPNLPPVVETPGYPALPGTGGGEVPAVPLPPAGLLLVAALAAFATLRRKSCSS